jgi:hypothetical protein
MWSLTVGGGKNGESGQKNFDEGNGEVGRVRAGGRGLRVADQE